MSLHQQIKDEMKQAMKDKDAVKLTTLRGLLSSFTNELVATKRMPQDELKDDEVLAVIKRESNRRKDSIKQFTDGGRPELAEDEQAELVILEAYLPAMMSREEIKPIVEAKAAELGVTDKSGAGKLTGAVMKDLQGKAEGTDVKALIDEMFV